MGAAESLPFPEAAGVVPSGDRCPVDHDRVQWTSKWAHLPFVGVMPSGDPQDPDLELRNCACGTTLCKPVPVQPEPQAAIATVILDVTDAFAVAHNLRTLARDKKTPLGTREVYNRVSSQIGAAALVASKAGGQ